MMSIDILWNDIYSILLFWIIVESLLLLIAKCVEIYVCGDELVLMQLSQVVCIVWTD